MSTSTQHNGENEARFNEVVDRCIEAIERGQTTVEACVAQFPEYPDLGDLLRMASALNDLPRPMMPAAFTAKTQQRLQAQLRAQSRAQKAPRSAPARPWWAPVLRVFATVAVILVIVFGLGAGLVSAAENTAPGDTLYGVKRLAEQVESGLTTLVNPDARPYILLRMAQERVREVNILTQRGQPVPESVLNDMTDQVNVASALQPDRTKSDSLHDAAVDAVKQGEMHGAISPDTAKTAIPKLFIMQIGSTSTAVASKPNATATPTHTAQRTAQPTRTTPPTATLIPTIPPATPIPPSATVAGVPLQAAPPTATIHVPPTLFPSVTPTQVIPPTQPPTSLPTLATEPATAAAVVTATQPVTPAATVPAPTAATEAATVEATEPAATAAATEAVTVAPTAATESATSAATEAATVEATEPPTATATATPTSTSTFTDTPTFTPTRTPTRKPTRTPTPTATPTATITPSPVPPTAVPTVPLPATSFKQTPKLEALHDCPPEGKDGDVALNKNLNRSDDGNYQLIPFDTVGTLPWPKEAEGKPHDQWPQPVQDQINQAEGLPITLDGYLVGAEALDPDPSNCNSPTDLDWQLSLTAGAQDDRAKAIMAIITPRIRANHTNWTPEKLQALANVKVRISGWLIFDSQNADDVGKTRIGLWEIAPVMQITVQKGDQWVPLDDYQP